MYNANTLDLGTAPCCIRQLNEYAQAQAQIVGWDNVYNFTIGNPSAPIPAEGAQALMDILQTCDPVSLHSYTSAVGALETRQAIADDLNKRFGADARAQDLFLTCGASPALCAVMHALSVEKGEIIVLCPYFPEYKPFAEAAGLKFVAVPASEPDFGLNLAGIAAAINKNTQMIIVNSPNNPSGVVYSQEQLKALSALLTEKSQTFGHPIYLIADEPYRELAYEGITVPFIPKLYKDTIVCYSYSKSLSLPGERIGYVYVSQYATDAEKICGAVNGAARILGHICAPSLMQKLIARCANLMPNLEDYDRNRKALYEGLTKAGYEMPEPLGAFYLFVKAPEGDATAFSERAKALNVLVVPGDDFGCPGYFRLCYCVPFEKIQRSIPLFEKLIQG